MRTLAISIALLVGVVATDVAISRRTHARARVGRSDKTAVVDCFGPDSIVEISPRRIGALPLDLTIAELRRRCATFGWTTTNGDESLDTAVLLTRPGLRVVGVVATLANEEGDRRPLQIDSGARIVFWKVSGTRGVLPGGVPITATWNDLRRAYGQLGASALNGTVYVTICRQPGIGVEITAVRPDAPINPENGKAQKPSTLDSVLGAAPIGVVEVAANLVRLNQKC